MNSVKTKVKTKCDIVGCKELATTTLLTDQMKIALELCDKCVKEIYESLGHVVKPACVPAPFKDISSKRRKNENKRPTTC